LASVTSGLFKQLTSGVVKPPGAAFDHPTDEDGNPIKTLQQQLETNPALGGSEKKRGSVHRVLLREFPNNQWNGKRYSSYQFLLEVELAKYELIATKTGGSNYFGRKLAYGVSHLGVAPSSKELVGTVYDILASQLVEQIGKNGINIIISGPTIASERFSTLPFLSEAQANALHFGNASRSVISLTENNDMAKLDNIFAVGPDSAVPEDVAIWNRKVARKKDGKSENRIGFRLVMTVTSVNAQFSVVNLPVLRNGIATTLSNTMPAALKHIKVAGTELPSSAQLDPTVDVKGCGYKPARVSEPPYPHDTGGCILHPPDVAK